MNVFLTGASGYLGSSVAVELKKFGNSVKGLARNLIAEASLREAGIDVVLGSLGDDELLESYSKGADAVIHTAFSHDFKDYVAAANADRHVVGVFAESLSDSNKPLIIASTAAVLADTRSIEADEDYPFDQDSNRFIRGETERDIQQFSSRGIRAIAIRLPLFVYGKGGSGFTEILIKQAKERGVSNYFGGGEQRYSAIYVEDAARFFVAALEKGTAKGVYNVATETVSLREIAEAIGRLLGVPAKNIGDAEAEKQFGSIYHPLAKNCVLSTERAKEEFEWQPQPFTEITEDIENGSYRVLI